jgi:hypothetical protein
MQYHLIWLNITNALEDSIEKSTLKMDVAVSSEMLVTNYQTAWLYILEDINLFFVGGTLEMR